MKTRHRELEKIIHQKENDVLWECFIVAWKDNLKQVENFATSF